MLALTRHEAIVDQVVVPEVVAISRTGMSHLPAPIIHDLRRIPADSGCFSTAGSVGTIHESPDMTKSSAPSEAQAMIHDPPEDLPRSKSPADFYPMREPGVDVRLDKA